jgi:translation initiation factor IF-2
VQIDRIYDWKPIPNNAFRDSLSKQKRHAQNEFADRVRRVIVEFAEQVSIQQDLCRHQCIHRFLEYRV